MLGVLWAFEHFKHYLLGQKFTVQTDQRALLSLLKERSSKIHQSRLTRWCYRLIPYKINIEHISGSKMGLADYMSRNPNDLPRAPTKYDDEFIIAQINIIKNTLNIIRKRGRPRKNTIDTEQTEQKDVKRRGRPRKNTTTTQDIIPHNNNNTIESSHDSNKTNHHVESPHNFTNNNSQTNSTQRNTNTNLQNSKMENSEIQQPRNSHKYSLHSKHKNNTNQERTTNNDVITNKQTTQHTVNKAHLPISLHITQKPALISINSNLNILDNNNETSQSKSTPKSNFSMSYFLCPLRSPVTDNLTTPSQDPRDRELTKAIHSTFNTQLIPAMINRDTVLREVRDCILANDEERCKKLCKQIHGQW